MAEFPFWLFFGAACGLGVISYLVFEHSKYRREIALYVFLVGLFILLAFNYILSHPIAR